MKVCIIILWVSVCVGHCLAQDQIQSQPILPQDGIEGWYKINSPVTGELNHVFFKNRDTGWANISVTSSIWTTNGGSTWQIYSDSIAVLGFFGSFGYGTTRKSNHIIVTSTNDGRSWKENYSPTAAFTYPYFSSPAYGVQSESPSHLAVTQDSGKTWSEAVNPAYASISGFTSFDSIHIFGIGTVYYDSIKNVISYTILSNDGGKTWFKTPTKILGSYLSYGTALDTSKAIIVGLKMFRSKNRGTTWSAIALPPGMPDLGTGGFDAITSTNGKNITAVGGPGLIIRSNDSGITWIKQTCPTNIQLNDVFFIDSTNGWAVGEVGTILHTNNAGYSWVQQNIIYDSLNVQVHPNPVRTQTTIGYTLPMPQHVTISILDVTGKVFLIPLSNQLQTQGANFLNFNAANLPPGTYLYQISTEHYQSNGKFTVIH